MLEVVDTGINSFASVASQADVSPIEEPVFILTSGQLEAIILQAIERATAPLEDRLSVLEREVRGRGAEGGEEPTRLPNAHTGQNLILQVVQDLRAKNMALKHELEDLQEVVPWIEALSKKMARLEAPKTSRKTEARAEKIARYLKERPDHKATYETLRGHLGIDKARLNEAVRHLMATEPGRYGTARLQGDKRGKVLIMLPK